MLNLYLGPGQVASKIQAAFITGSTVVHYATCT